LINVTDRFVAITPHSGYRRHLPENEVCVLYLEPNASETAVGQALVEMLDRSRFIHPDDDRDFYDFERIVSADKRWHENVMTTYRYKTKRELYKNMRYCLAECREGWLIITPHKRDKKPEFWWDLPEDKTVLIPATDDPGIVGAAVKLALSHCE
jgi:hypothetical protein